MDKITAQRIVRDTFKVSFDKGRYRNFVNELCNGFDETKAQTMRVPDAFARHIKSCLRNGTFESKGGELADILTVHLTESYKLERTRTALRDFVGHKLKRGDGEDNSYKEAALVAFVAPDSQSWRFSYVRMEYETKRDPSTGKIKPEERLTPARRYSYLVGEEEECHTAQSRFLALLQNTSDIPTLDHIEEAFSVDAVTDEFFDEYAAFFEKIKGSLDKLVRKDPKIAAEFSKKQVRTADFAKKLMGQIVFLYFIQKKGWLGVEKGKNWGTGPHDFLRKLARGEYGKYENFFNDTLEPLFYATLAEDRTKKGDWSKEFNCRIPFLNGGLFEPLSDYDWRKTDIVLPNQLFTNSERFDDFTRGTGLLDMFDRYNFTVNEAEPLEKEVAIDPEMLGKVFENLIEENLRKGLGSYYTPREIVHYMCQESLINYLDMALNSSTETIGHERRKQAQFDDEKAEQSLLTTATRDEIVPRADIATFVHLGDQISHYESVETRYAIKMPKSIEQHARLIDDKLKEVTVCDPAVGSGAFPVGMMSEIVRARSALTYKLRGDIEEEDVSESQKEARLKTLALSHSAYGLKKHAIQNCLYGVDIDPGAVEIAKLRLWLSLVVDEEDVKQIKPLPNLFYKIVTGNSLLGVEKGELENWKALRRLEELKPKFFDEPHGERKHAYQREINTLIRELTDGNQLFDFEIYFSEVFHARGGFDVVIANPPYVDSEVMVREQPAIRTAIGERFSTTKGNWDLYIPFLELSIKKLSQRGTSCLITPNKWLAISYGQAFRAFVKKMIYAVADYSRFRAFETVGVFPVVELASPGEHQTIEIARFSDGHKRVFSTSVPRGTFAQMSTWGAVLSEHLPLVLRLIAENAPLRTICELEEAFTVGEAYELTKILRDDGSHAAFRFINTGTIEPFFTLWGHSPTTYLKKKYLRPTISRVAFKQKFPKRYIQMTSPKIIISGMRHFEAILDLSGDVIAGKSTVVVRGIAHNDEWMCLLGILNSQLAKFFLKECYSALAMDGGINFSPTNVGEIPIAAPFVSKELLRVVRQILAIRGKSGPNTSARDEQSLAALTNALDQEVFRLYRLTEREKAIVRA